MLERAGAVIYTPRERDWQKNEVLVDNDNGRGYVEDDGQFATMGGESNEPMVKLLDTYEAMATKIAGDRGISGAKATRSFINSWTDVSATKDLTSSMIDEGSGQESDPRDNPQEHGQQVLRRALRKQRLDQECHEEWMQHRGSCR